MRCANYTARVTLSKQVLASCSAQVAPRPLHATLQTYHCAGHFRQALCESYSEKTILRKSLITLRKSRWAWRKPLCPFYSEQTILRESFYTKRSVQVTPMQVAGHPVRVTVYRSLCTSHSTSHFVGVTLNRSRCPNRAAQVALLRLLCASHSTQGAGHSAQITLSSTSCAMRSGTLRKVLCLSCLRTLLCKSFCTGHSRRMTVPNGGECFCWAKILRRFRKKQS